MSQKFDPSTWIDEQRQGGGRNVFDSILAESQRLRRERHVMSEDRIVTRVERVMSIRRAAAEHDAEVSPRSQEAQTFLQMVNRWKGMQ